MNWKTITLIAIILISGIVVLVVGLTQRNSLLLNKSEVYKTGEIGLDLGDTAPDLVYNSPSDTLIALSSLRGKMVLIDFWAAWCAPCRTENKNLVETYTIYKNKKFDKGVGFEVYSISLDRQKAPWIQAIKEDNLIWPYHVSDLKGWRSVPAAIYQVMGIPYNFLIDGEGVIIGKNLRGKALSNTLSNHLAR